MSKRVKNRKGQLNRKGRYDKQFYKEGSSSRTSDSLPHGIGSGYPWWLFIRFYPDGCIRLPTDRRMV